MLFVDRPYSAVLVTCLKTGESVYIEATRGRSSNREMIRKAVQILRSRTAPDLPTSVQLFTYECPDDQPYPKDTEAFMGARTVDALFPNNEDES